MNEIEKKESTKDKNDRLLIAVRVKKTIIYLEDILDNFPHKNLELKKNISNTMYEILECIYLANMGYEKEKNKALALVKMQMIDFYLLVSYKKILLVRKILEYIY